MNIFVESYGLGYETTREQREEKKKGIVFVVK